MVENQDYVAGRNLTIADLSIIATVTTAEVCIYITFNRFTYIILVGAKYYVYKQNENLFKTTGTGLRSGRLQERSKVDGENESRDAGLQEDQRRGNRISQEDTCRDAGKLMVATRLLSTRMHNRKEELRLQSAQAAEILAPKKILRLYIMKNIYRNNAAVCNNICVYRCRLNLQL